MICPSPAKGYGVVVGSEVSDGMGVEGSVRVGRRASVGGSGEGVGSAVVSPQADKRMKAKQIKSLEYFINTSSKRWE